MLERSKRDSIVRLEFGMPERDAGYFVPLCSRLFSYMPDRVQTAVFTIPKKTRQKRWNTIATGKADTSDLSRLVLNAWIAKSYDDYSPPLLHADAICELNSELGPPSLTLLMSTELLTFHGLDLKWLLDQALGVIEPWHGYGYFGAPDFPAEAHLGFADSGDEGADSRLTEFQAFNRFESLDKIRHVFDFNIISKRQLDFQVCGVNLRTKIDMIRLGSVQEMSGGRVLWQVPENDLFQARTEIERGGFLIGESYRSGGWPSGNHQW